MRRAEGGEPMFAVVATGGAVFAIAVVNVSAVLLSVMAIVGPQALGASQTRTPLPAHEQPDRARRDGLGPVHRRVRDRDHPRSGVLPRVLGWIGALIALVFLATGGGIASTRDVFFYLGFVGFLAFSLWTLVVSVMMYRAPSRAGAPVSAA